MVCKRKFRVTEKFKVAMGLHQLKHQHNCLQHLNNTPFEVLYLINCSCDKRESADSDQEKISVLHWHCNATHY